MAAPGSRLARPRWAASSSASHSSEGPRAVRLALRGTWRYKHGLGRIIPVFLIVVMSPDAGGQLAGVSVGAEVQVGSGGGQQQPGHEDGGVVAGQGRGRGGQRGQHLYSTVQ